MEKTADVLVVGAGVVGCSIALAQAQRHRRVLVVDAGRGPGQGSTSASSAIVRFNYSTFDGIALAWESRQWWSDWGADLPAGTPVARFHESGMAFLDVDVAPQEGTLRHFDRAGIAYERWGAEELAARLPGIDAGRFWPPLPIAHPDFGRDADQQLGAVWTPEAGYVDDPTLAAENLATAARLAGAHFRFGARVVAVLGDSTATGVQLADGTTLHAAVVVNAAGPWSSAMNAMAGVGAGWTVTTRPMRQEVHAVPAPAGGARLPCIADMDLGTYIRSTPSGGWIIGGTEPECDPLEWLDDADDALLSVTTAGFERQVLRVARRFPDLGVPARPSGVAGVYDVTDDWSPIYDRTERDGYVVAIGTSGNQFKNAPMIGTLMAGVIDGEDEVVGPRTGLPIGLSGFRRDRARNADSTGTVLG